VTDEKSTFRRKVFGGPRSHQTKLVLGDPKVIYQNFGPLPPPLYAYHVYVGIKKCFGLLLLPPKMHFRLAASATKLAAAAAAALPPLRCHRHAAAAYTNAKLPTPPTPRSCQAVTAAAKLAAAPTLPPPPPSPSFPSLLSSLSSPPFPCF
jgi:hypothetical protein